MAYVVKLGDTKVNVKTMYLDAIFLICSRALMLAQTSAVNMDAESGNLMEITVFDGKTVAHATEFPYLIHLYKQECDHGTCLVFP